MLVYIGTACHVVRTEDARLLIQIDTMFLIVVNEIPGTFVMRTLFIVNVLAHNE